MIFEFFESLGLSSKLYPTASDILLFLYNHMSHITGALSTFMGSSMSAVPLFRVTEAGPDSSVNCVHLGSFTCSAGRSVSKGTSAFIT